MRTISQFILLLALMFILIIQSANAQQGMGYTYPQYPYGKDLSQTLTFKIMLRCARPEDVSNLDMGRVLNYIKQVDCITRGLPKIVILGGFQQDGHDHQYPWWTPINDSFTAPGGLTGKEALLWLMQQARRYNTNCTFHVNPFDAYKDSPKWSTYQEKDLICRKESGSLIPGGVWWNRQSYMVNLVKEWESGVTKQKIDEFLEEVPLVKETGVLYFDNITQYPASPYHGITQNDQRDAIKKCAEYLKQAYGIQLIGEYADPQLYGFLSQGITWDWNESLNVNQMEIPAYIMCGGRDIAHDTLLGQTINLKPHLQVFGTSLQLEDIQFQYNPDRVLREFTHHTLTYFYLNRLLRKEYVHEGSLYRLTLSDNVVSEYSDDIHKIYRDNKLVKKGYDVFLPVYWQNHPEIMTYSLKGGKFTWNFPKEWAQIRNVDIYTFNESFNGLSVVELGRTISGNQISLMMEANKALLVVPAGTDMTIKETIYSNAPSGIVKFLNKDEVTQGNWTSRYGTLGYEVFGCQLVKEKNNVKIEYVGDELVVKDGNAVKSNALLYPNDKSKRIQAVRTSRLHQLIDINVSEEKPLKISLYFADYENKNIQMLVDVIDVNTKQVLHSTILKDFVEGVYLSYSMKGHLQVRLTRFFYDYYNDPDYPVCSGIFIDTDMLTGIDNNVEKNLFYRVWNYPNPFRSWTTFYVNVDKPQNIQLKIYSPQGYLLFSNSYYAYEAGITNFTVSEADINKGYLSNGLYLYMIQTETFHIGGQLLLN